MGVLLLARRGSKCPPIAVRQVKADKDSTNLCKLQQASRGVTQATAAVVASTKAGKSQVEEKGECGAARAQNCPKTSTLGAPYLCPAVPQGPCPGLPHCLHLAWWQKLPGV